MANESSAVRSNSVSSAPERTLRIEGERTAAMFAISVRVSRIDIRLRELASSTTPEGRKAYRLAREGYEKAMANFEDALTLVEKDAEVGSRRPSQSQHRRSQQQTPRPAQTPPKPSSPGPAISGKPAVVPPKDGKAKGGVETKEQPAQGKPATQEHSARAQEKKQPSQASNKNAGKQGKHNSGGGDQQKAPKPPANPEKTPTTA